MSAGKIIWDREYKNFRRLLIAAREEAGLSQRAASSRLGKPHSWVGKCETGERRVDIVELVQLAQIYGKPLDYFASPALRAHLERGERGEPGERGERETKRERNGRGQH